MTKVDYSNLSPQEAFQIQNEMRQQLRLEPLPQMPRTIGGADISFNKYSEVVYAGIVVLSYPAMQVIDKATVVTRTRFPYVPGLLAFREAPALLEVWEQLGQKPDVLVLDGHGIAHPRRMGIATHFGLLADAVTLGCAKSLLTGHYGALGEHAGATTDLVHQDEVVGKVLRTKNKCNPVFVSPGNRITLEESLDIILHSVGKYRIPEPTRLAHLLVNEVRIIHGK